MLHLQLCKQLVQAVCLPEQLDDVGMHQLQATAGAWAEDGVLMGR